MSSSDKNPFNTNRARNKQMEARENHGETMAKPWGNHREAKGNQGFVLFLLNGITEMGFVGCWRFLFGICLFKGVYPWGRVKETFYTHG